MFAIYSSEEEDGQNDYGFKFPWKNTVITSSSASDLLQEKMKIRLVTVSF